MNKRQAVISGSLTATVAALAIAVIMKWEGQYFLPYRDPVGILTVCYGHTGSEVIADKRYTLAECNDLLQHDLDTTHAIVQRCLPMPKPDHVQAALVSATFNIGARVVCGSALQRKALAGDWAGACAQLDRWVSRSMFSAALPRWFGERPYMDVRAGVYQSQ